MSPFDLKITCLCQRIKINDSKQLYRQNQVRKPTGGEVKWAECSLVIGTGYRVQVLAWSSIAQTVSEWAFSLLAIWFLTLRLPSFESCIQQRKPTCLLSIRKMLASARASKLTATNMYIGACVCSHRLYIYMYMYIYIYQFLPGYCKIFPEGGKNLPERACEWVHYFTIRGEYFTMCVGQ